MEGKKLGSIHNLTKCAVYTYKVKDFALTPPKGYMFALRSLANSPKDFIALKFSLLLLEEDFSFLTPF